MTRPANLLVCIALGVALSAICAAPPSKKNTIVGTVVSKPDTMATATSYPVADAVAVAYDSGNKPVGLSDATGADGRFSLVVPESIMEFTLLVYQKQQRYWDYRPKDLFPNRSHPHDLGSIVLSDKLELSEDDASMQVEAAILLHVIDAFSSALLMDKVTDAYLRQYVPRTNHGCPGAPVPTAIEVAYRPALLQLRGSAGQSTSAQPSIQGRARMLLNAMTALEFMRRINAAEQQYFVRSGGYAGFDELNHLGGLTSTFFPPGYCIELLAGHLIGKAFTFSKNGPLNYYLLFAVPSSWGVTGNMYLYSDPAGQIRYTRSREKLKSLNDAPPIPKDFPLGLEP